MDADVAERFDRVDEMFRGVAEQFERMDRVHAQRHAQLLEVLGIRFDGIDRRFEAIDQRFDYVATEMNRRFAEQNAKMAGQFELMQKRTDERFDELKELIVDQHQRLDRRVRRLEGLG